MSAGIQQIHSEGFTPESGQPSTPIHSLAFPSFSGAALTINNGWLGLQYLFTKGGTGYFPARMLREQELAGRLHRVPDAPEFRLSAYLCFPSKTDSTVLTLALDTIRRVAADAA